MRNISTAVRGPYDDDRYMWAIIIRRFCDKLLMGSFNFDEVSPSTLPYGTMCWPIESEFTLSLTNKLLFLIGLLQLLVRISLIDAKIEIV
jgi:hypothetical protein